MGMLNRILKFYKGMFDRIWIVSPSVHLDPQYKVLRDHLDKMCDQKKEKLYFEDWDAEKIGQILDQQREIVESCRKRKVPAPHVLLVLDDLGDHTDIMQARRGGKIGGSHLTTLATKGRHFQVSWMVTAQKFNQIGRVVRSNARNLLVWRQRNAKEVESLCEELSGWYDKDTVLQMYEHATAEPYSWLTVRLDAKKREDAFWLRFEKRLLPESDEEVKEDGGVHAGEPVGPGARKPASKRRPRSPSPGPQGAGGGERREDPQAPGRDPGGKAVRPRTGSLPSNPAKKAPGRP
jgi:hypothetical protein